MESNEENIPEIMGKKIMQTKDVVDVVRCRDCKHYAIAWLKKDGSENKRYRPSVCIHSRYAVSRNPDWFCADAERRDDGEIH